MNFLIKLFKERKLELVETSDEIKESYLEKSESCLISSKILFDNDRLEESVGLAYYSMYNAVLALFFKCGIKCENHAASIILLKEVFDFDNTNLSEAKKERIDKQYYVGFEVTKDDVKKAIEVTEDFNHGLLDFISKVNNENEKEIQQ